MYREADAHVDAQDAHRRADAAAATTAGRYAPVTVANRIERLSAELRGWERARDGHQRTLFTDAQGRKCTEQTAGATGERRDAVAGEVVRLSAEITYWEQVRREQEADGVMRIYDRTIIATGDTIKSSGRWYEVVRVNAKSVNVATGHSWTDRVSYHRIQDHRSATDMAAAAPSGSGAVMTTNPGQEGTS